MNRKIHLLGELAQFGDIWQMHAKSISDVIQLIECQEVGFRKFLIDAVEAGLDLAIIGKDFRVEEPDELLFENLGPEEVYISLVPAGSKKGWGKILLAAVLIIVGAILTFTPAAPLGKGMIMAGISIGLQGITQLLAKTPRADKPDATVGLFDGPESTLKQGQPVPVLYGELLIGGAPIHMDMTSAVQRDSSTFNSGGGYANPLCTVRTDPVTGEVNLTCNEFSSATEDGAQGPNTNSFYWPVVEIGGF